MRPAVALEGGLVVIRAPKCVLVLTAEEIAGLVRFDREVWIRAIRRGKFYRRGEAMVRRLAAVPVADPMKGQKTDTPHEGTR